MWLVDTSLTADRRLVSRAAISAPARGRSERPRGMHRLYRQTYSQTNSIWPTNSPTTRTAEPAGGETDLLRWPKPWVFASQILW